MLKVCSDMLAFVSYMVPLGCTGETSVEEVYTAEVQKNFLYQYKFSTHVVKKKFIASDA